MQSALVSKGRSAHEWCADVRRDVREFGHKLPEFAQFREVVAHGDSELQLQIRDCGDEVAIPHTLAVTIDGSLDLARADFDCCERICHAESAIVVRVDAHRAAKMRDGFLRHFRDEAGQIPSVCLAQNHKVRASVGRGLDGRERILRVVFIRIEKMLRVVKHFAPFAFQIAHRIADHREIFLRRDFENMRDMQRPGLADHADHRRLRIQQRFYLRVFFDLGVSATRHTESRKFSVLPSPLRRFREKLRVLRIAPRPTAFDVVDSELIELFRHANFIEHRERNSCALRSVAEGCIV
jgi:hypothetical protein